MSNATTHIDNKPSLRASHCEDEGRSKRKQTHPLVPALRFNEFEESWHSEFFESFLSDKNALAYGVLQPGEDVEGGVPMLRTVDLNDFGLKGNTVILRIPKKMDLQYKRTKLAGGELIISVMGTLGRTVIVPAEWKGWNVNRALAVARLNESIDKWFLIQTLHTPKFKKKVVEEALGSAQKRINLGDLKEYKFTLPSLPEQQKIASFLSAVDEKIQQLTKKKTLLEEYKKGVMQQLFSSQLRFKDENGKAYPDWEEIKVQKLIDKKAIIGLLDGNHGELYPKSEEFTEHGVPYVAANSLVNGLVNFSECKRLPIERAAKFKKGIAINGDVLFAHNATVGPTAILKTEFDYVILSTTVTYYRCNNKILSNRYLLQYFNSDNFIRQYTRVMSQSTRNQVPITMQKKFKVLFPCIEEQQKIATYLSGIATKIEAVNNQITKTQTFKKGLLQQMFV